MPITVAIVEDNQNLRLGTSYILHASPKYKVVGEYETAEELLEDFREINPDVVLMDIGLPGMSGIDATGELKRRNPRVQIVMLSVFDDDENVFQAICAGTCGYIAKPAMPAQLLEAVEPAFDGASPMSPHIARKVLELFRRHIPPPKADYNLTGRELEVLELLTQGDDHKQIAEKLFSEPLHSARPPAQYLRQAARSLQVTSRRQGAARAAGAESPMIYHQAQHSLICTILLILPLVSRLLYNPFVLF